MLEGKVALVTGASRGIGYAIATALKKQGAIVVGTATSDKGAANMLDWKGMVLDVTSDDSIKALLDTMKDTVGMPDILVNNAGITADNIFMRMNNEQWDTVLDANLKGVFRLMKACSRSMVKKKWGRVINISSVVAYSGNPGQANYSAAKAGMVALSKSVAQEIASRGITINVVAPGFIATDMTEKLNDDQYNQLMEKIPMGRMGTPEDIAHAVQFLASDAASYITGETIHVNGGMLMN